MKSAQMSKKYRTPSLLKLEKFPPHSAYIYGFKNQIRIFKSTSNAHTKIVGKRRRREGAPTHASLDASE